MGAVTEMAEDVVTDVLVVNVGVVPEGAGDCRRKKPATPAAKIKRTTINDEDVLERPVNRTHRGWK